MHDGHFPVNGPTNVLCDEEPVFKGATQSEAMLKKEHNAMAHDKTGQAVPVGIAGTAWWNGCFWSANVLTDFLCDPSLCKLIGCILDQAQKSFPIQPLTKGHNDLDSKPVK